jgi:mRNA-degrading endonuclease RelE of RelBE toxin-antitoxin system
MRHLASASFWEAYRRLPENIRLLADKNYELLKQNPRHPSLHLKKVGRFWSVRIGTRYRALAVGSMAACFGSGSALTRTMMH